MRERINHYLASFLEGFCGGRGLPDFVKSYVLHKLFHQPMPSGDLGKLARAHIAELKRRMLEGDERAREEISETATDFLVKW